VIIGAAQNQSDVPSVRQASGHLKVTRTPTMPAAHAIRQQRGDWVLPVGCGP